MDPQWSGAPPSGSITCMLCRGSVPFSKTETQNFWSHLQHHHGVFYHHDVLISVNLLSKNYLSRIVQDYEKSGEKSELVGEEDSEEIVELEETVERASSNVNIPRKNKIKQESKVHNCKTCNEKFERLGDLIEHVNEHKAEEKRQEEEIELKRQTLEKERRRAIEEKKIIKQQKEIEKRRLEDAKAKVKMEMDIKRRAEVDERKRKLDIENDESSRGREEIAKMRATLKQFSESDDVGVKEELSRNQVGKESIRPPVVFECQECSYTTKRNIELKLHKLSHTGEKNFACEHCDEKFYLDRHLKRHALKHTTEFAKKFNVQNTVLDEPSQFAAFDTSLPVNPYADETITTGEHSSSDVDQTKKKLKRPRTESVQDTIMNVLSEDSNQEDARVKVRGSLEGRGISEIAANSEYFQKFPKQIRRGVQIKETFTEQEPSMPEGWKFRELGKARSNGRIDREYLSPDLMVFRSKRSMVEYMKIMGEYSQEEIERAERRN